jgi:hypothetical protein
MTFQHYLALERSEILRHKWIESEKAGHDLGEDAIFDWVEKHATAFHQYITQILGERIECGPIMVRSCDAGMHGRP